MSSRFSPRSLPPKKRPHSVRTVPLEMIRETQHQNVVTKRIQRLKDQCNPPHTIAVLHRTLQQIEDEAGTADDTALLELKTAILRTLTRIEKNGKSTSVIDE
jgi:hypothetical protein